jgi:hypothetical protein
MRLSDRRLTAYLGFYPNALNKAQRFIPPSLFVHYKRLRHKT